MKKILLILFFLMMSTIIYGEDDSENGGPWDALGRGISQGAQNYLEGKRRQEEKRRYEREQDAREKEWLLREEQIRQQMDIEKQQAERERRLWSPGREEKMGFTGALPYIVKGEEPGIYYQTKQAELALAQKQLEGYETPTATHD